MEPDRQHLQLAKLIICQADGDCTLGSTLCVIIPIGNRENTAYVKSTVKFHHTHVPILQTQQWCFAIWTHAQVCSRHLCIKPFIIHIHVSVLYWFLLGQFCSNTGSAGTVKSDEQYLFCRVIAGLLFTLLQIVAASDE